MNSAGDGSGYYYEIRQKLKRVLSHQQHTLGKPLTPIQQDAWRFICEVEELIRLLNRLEQRYIKKDDPSDLALEARVTLVKHLPARSNPDPVSIEG